jgi:UPF0716 family protein affecting phage T7 exclusion
MGIGIARLLVLVSGALLAIGGLLLILVPGFGGTIAGVYMILIGAALIAGALLERMRYRSDALDRSSPPIGPGGGEPIDTPLESRFTSTDEVFTDPTSGHRMRVFMDRRTGERRYRAEG